jgi:HlyD family secretion protein
MQTTIPFPRAQGQSGARRSRRWLRWLVVPVALAVIAGGALWWRSSQQVTTPNTSTGTVTQGDLAATISGSGTIAAARTVALPFQQAGTVTSVDVQVGDTVQAGQALAKIDAGDLELQLQQAQANLKAAQASYAAAKDGRATEQDLASAQASLDSAKAQLQQTRTGSATAADIASAKAQLASTKAQLEALKNPSDADRSAAQRAVDQARLSLQSMHDSASQAKTNAQIALQNAVNALTQAQSKYASAKNNWDYVQNTGNDPANPSTTNAAGEKVPNTLNDSQRQAYYDAYVQAQAALDSAQNGVTQAQVSYDSARQSEVTQVQQAEAALVDAQQQLDALLNPSAAGLAQAQAAVTQAQSNLTNLQQGGTAAAVAQAQASVTQAQANLESLTAPASEAELASSEAAVLQAQVAVATAQANLDEATLTAPFGGVVAAVDIVPGGAASAGTAAITLVDDSKLHIDVSPSEADAADVQVGQSATLTFDALPDVTLAGTVATIAPVATTEQNVVTYVAQIAFDPGSAAVKVGMSATADIQVAQVSGALLVPSRAVQTSGSGKTVTVVRGDITTAIPVETGLTSNGQTAIVSSGGDGATSLKAGDVVVIAGSSTSTSQSSTSNGGGLGGLTGGPPVGPGGP